MSGSAEWEHCSAELNEAGWNMRSSEELKIGTRHRRVSTRLFALLSIMALVAAMLVPTGAGATPIVAAHLSVTPTTLNAVRTVSQTWTITATDSNNLPLAGATIAVFRTGVNTLAVTTLGTTDVNGQITYSYAGTNSGTDTLTFFNDANGDQTLDNNEQSVTATVVWSTPAFITLSPTALTRAVDKPLVMTATVTDSGHTPLAGASVSYVITGPNSTSGTLTTGSTGTVTFTDPGNFPGIDTITATTAGVATSATASIQWILGGGILMLTPTNSSPAINTTVTLTATLEQANGDPIAGVPIYFNVSGQNYRVASVTSDANGVATFQYSSTLTGSDTVLAYADFDRSGTQTAGEAANTAYVNWVASTSAGLALAPSSQTVTTGSQASVDASLTVASASGVQIRYVVTGPNATSGTVTTDLNGNATISYTGSSAGTDTMSAYADLNGNGSQDAGEPTASATVTWSSSSLALVPSSQSLTTGAPASVTATYHNANGSSSGATVRYAVSGANTTSGSLTTDTNGNATISYSGTNAGSDTISAYVDVNNNGVQDAGEPSDTATVTWTAPQPSVFQPAQPAAPKAGCTYFPATHHNLCAGFQAYWNQFGGLAIFGMPLTEEFQVNGVTTQYFERARFEWHPGTFPARYDVLLGLLGNEVTAGRQSETPFQATTANASSSCTYYAATGHNLCAGFQAYWNQNGGLATFGYPISEEFQEKNPDTGLVYTVQYFERARFEWHPGENPANFDVELGRLGAQVLQMKYGVSYS